VDAGVSKKSPAKILKSVKVEIMYVLYRFISFLYVMF
jgi:hypothetical protein